MEVVRDIEAGEEEPEGVVDVPKRLLAESTEREAGSVTVEKIFGVGLGEV